MNDIIDYGEKYLPQDQEVNTEKRKDTDMYLIAAYMAMGATLLRREVESVSHGRKLLVVEGDPFVLQQVERDWYEPDRVVKTLPANILKRYKTAIQDVKALIHSSEA
jgi:hypothetical protein